MNRTGTCRHRVIGIDLDNTIIDYGPAYEAALNSIGYPYNGEDDARKLLKSHFLKLDAGNLKWTLFQGKLYTEFLQYAELFRGVSDVIQRWIDQKIDIRIISHKTRYTAVGPVQDLRSASEAWLQHHLFSRLRVDDGDTLKVRYVDTIEEKLHAIYLERCVVFIDDLEIVLRHPSFPRGTKAVLFGGRECRNWKDLEKQIDCIFAVESYAACYKKQERKRASSEVSFREMLNGMGEISKQTQLLSGGINNAVFKIQCESGRIYCGKYYRVDRDDPRDRMHHEVTFLEFCETHHIDCVPKVIATDWVNKAVLLTFVYGELWQEQNPASPEIWWQFRHFIASLQLYQKRIEAQHLPRAAEGANSLQEHLGWVQKRRDHWRHRALTETLDPEIAERVLGPLENEYQKVAEVCIAHPHFKKPFPVQRQVISPSDFGLHNALVDGDGNVTFIDFEYSGWDDSEKLNLDFSLQPRYAKSRNPLDFNPNPVDPEEHQIVEELLRLKWAFIKIASHSKTKRFPHFEPAVIC